MGARELLFAALVRLLTRQSFERRRSRRYDCVEEHGILTAQIRPGYMLQLINISASGALVESVHRLLPGRSIELHVRSADHRAVVRGRLIRSTIVGLQPSAVWYRGAIKFENELPWLLEEEDGAADQAFAG